MMPEREGGQLVLLVDDNETNLDILSAFVIHAGRGCVLARSGAEAVALAGVQHFDMILMDIQMPGMDGIEAARRIREIPGRRGQVPIAALTAYAHAENTVICREAGMCGVITKPLDFNTLAAVLEQFMPSGSLCLLDPDGTA